MKICISENTRNNPTYCIDFRALSEAEWNYVSNIAKEGKPADDAVWAARGKGVFYYRNPAYILFNLFTPEGLNKDPLFRKLFNDTVPSILERYLRDTTKSAPP